VTEPRAKELLDKLGFTYEPEPKWITSGRKPDFYCSEPSECWCEVKTLERSEDFERLSKALEEFQRRTAGLSGSGMGIVYVSETMSHRDAKLAVELLKRALTRLDDSDKPDIVVSLVPTYLDRKNFVRFSIDVPEGKKAEFHSCASTSGRYAVPSGLYPQPDSQSVELKFSSGRTKQIEAHTVIDDTDNFRAAITVYAKKEAHFEIVSAVRTGAARRLKTVSRIRDVVSDANEQAKNGNAYKEAPSVTVVFQDGPDVPDDTIVKSALYGDLKYVATKSNPASGHLALEGDGAWNSTKNRSTSAVIYIRNNRAPIVIHNYWAHRPLPVGLFSCLEISVGADGHFQENDFSQSTDSGR
jgi:hypothetical protein